MYSLGTIPREHFRGDAERQLLAVRRRVSYVIGRLGVDEARGGGRVDGAAARRLRQGDRGVTRRAEINFQAPHAIDAALPWSPR